MKMMMMMKKMMMMVMMRLAGMLGICGGVCTEGNWDDYKTM